MMARRATLDRDLLVTVAQLETDSRRISDIHGLTFDLHGLQTPGPKRHQRITLVNRTVAYQGFHFAEGGGYKFQW